jgi:hypothetical protein
MFDYFTYFTEFLADGENYCNNEHYLKGRLADNAEREQWRNLQIDVFSRLIIDAINRKSVGTCIVVVGVMPHIIFGKSVQIHSSQWTLPVGGAFQKPYQISPIKMNSVNLTK